MRNVLYKGGAALATASLMGLLLTGGVLAADLEITDNGADSHNKIEVKVENKCEVVQATETNVEALVGASASTGGNTASGNTGGDTSITTGNATATATLTVTGGSNTATDPCCCQKNCCEEGCTDGLTAKISDNGARSHNKIKVTKKGASSLVQAGSTNVGALVGARAKTGKNKAKNNTGGTTTIDTGTARSDAFLEVIGGSNTINP